DFPLLADIARTALLCNDASLRYDKTNWQVTGDPTEGALLTLARKAGLGEGQAKLELPRLDVIPFEAEHRFMATLNRDIDGRPHICLKGPQELILSLCVYQRTSHGDTRLVAPAWTAQMEKAAR